MLHCWSSWLRVTTRLTMRTARTTLLWTQKSLTETATLGQGMTLKKISMGLLLEAMYPIGTSIEWTRAKATPSSQG